MDKAPLPKPLLRVVQAEVQRIIGKDLDGIKDTMKRIEAQNCVIITQQNNRRIADEAFTSRFDKLIATLLTCHEEPTKLGEIQAVLRDFLNQKQSQNNRKST